MIMEYVDSILQSVEHKITDDAIIGKRVSITKKKTFIIFFQGYSNCDVQENCHAST